MRLLITGATGLLGTELVRRLSEDHQLLGWSRHLPKKPAHPQARYEQVDLTNSDAVRRGFLAFKPEGVLHTAAQSDVDACERDPALAQEIHPRATALLAAQSVQHHALLMAVSTDYVFDGKAAHPNREEDPTDPVSQYGRSKLEAEQAALKGNPRCLVVRVSGLFGAGHANFVLTAAQRLKAGQTVSAVTDQTNSPSYTLDVASGFAQLLNRLKGDPEAINPGGPMHGVMHLANAGGASRLQVVQFIARLLGAPDSLIQAATWADLNRPADRPANSRLDCRRFRHFVGRSLRPWEEALREFLSFPDGPAWSDT